MIFLEFLFFKPITILYEIILTICWKVFNLKTTLLLLFIIANTILVPLYLAMRRLQVNEYSVKEKKKIWINWKTFLPYIFQLYLVASSFIFFDYLDAFSGSSIWFLKDITLSDGLIYAIFGNINLLPIVYFILSIILSVILNRKQIVLLIFSIIIDALCTFILYSAPSGAVLFACSSLLIFFFWDILFFYVLRNRVKWEFGKQTKNEQRAETETLKPQVITFLLAVVYIIVLTGSYIPSNIINDSPAEFIDILDVKNPLHFLIYSNLLALGTLSYFCAFYFLAGRKVQIVMDGLIWLVCGMLTINYLSSGSYWGELTPALVYFDSKEFGTLRVIISVALGLLIGGILCFLIWKKSIIAKLIIIVELGILIMSTLLNVIRIEGKYIQMDYLADEDSQGDIIHLSQNGKNVVVLVMDRALSICVPYIFEEKPELKAQFDGFTYYPNTISFGGYTNTAIPAVYGGYEYIPEKINERSDETLGEKQNEALKVMPVLFDENGFEVTVCDPPYAGYQWIPDLSIYDDYPNIRAFNTDGRFNSTGPDDVIRTEELLQRNFFLHSVMKIMPLTWQLYLYNNGRYCNQQIQAQLGNPKYTSDGYDNDFLDSYLVLDNLEEITNIQDDSTNQFLLFYNATPHMPCLLQEPDYIPQNHVDNNKYQINNTERYTVNGKTIRMEESKQITHYHVNMAMFLKLGEWFDYLKENDCYDNTRIIIVSDHGRDTNYYDLIIEDGMDVEYFLPLLMVKDFNEKGFEIDSLFMTNADTPAIAMEQLIDAPCNPFTGNRIDNDDIKGRELTIFYLDKCKLEDNPGKTFQKGKWYSFEGNPYDTKSWYYLGAY